jgi:hypothetical protein
VFKKLCHKKCGYCDRYFLPYSVVSLYCDRLVDGKDKTCKEIAATEKYNQKVNSDAAKSFILSATTPIRCALPRPGGLQTGGQVRMARQRAEAVEAGRSGRGVV